jgi:hypothetical protein
MYFCQKELVGMRFLTSIILIISLTFIKNSACQGFNKFYAYATTGYKLGSVFTTFPEDFIATSSVNQNIYGRLGGGNTFSGAFGWMFHKNFGCEISSAYHLGSPKTIATQNDLSTGEFIQRDITTHSFHSVGSLVAQAYIAKFILYAKAGIVLGWYGSSKISDQYQFNTTSPRISYQYEHNMKIARGFNGSLGILYPIGKGWSVMLEAEEVSIQSSFQSATLLKNPNALNLPEKIDYVADISGKGLEFKKEIPVSYSCIGMNIGLHYGFGTKK